MNLLAFLHGIPKVAKGETIRLNGMWTTSDLCRQGHAMTPDNVRVSGGRRRCRECILESERRRK